MKKRLSIANKSGVTGVRKRPDCSIMNFEAFIHINGVKFSMHSATMSQAIRDRKVLEMMSRRLKATNLLRKH
ncbi:hypothetical protein [Enterobacter mori]